MPVPLLGTVIGPFWDSASTCVYECGWTPTYYSSPWPRKSKKFDSFYQQHSSWTWQRKNPRSSTLPHLPAPRQPMSDSRYEFPIAYRHPGRHAKPPAYATLFPGCHIHNSPPPTYEEAVRLQVRPRLPSPNSAVIHRTIVWPTTACIGSIVTYFAPQPDDTDGDDE